MNTGYIKLWRKIQDNFIYSDSYLFHIWIHLLLDANHEEIEFLFNGKKQMCKRGEFITGLHKISESTGIPQTTILRKLNILKNEGLIKMESNNRFRLIKIGKYDEYQNTLKNGKQNGKRFIDEEQEKTESKTENKWKSNGNQTETNNNDKNEKNDKNILKEYIMTIPPKIEDVLTYIKEKGYPVDGYKWFSHYEAKGWMIGKSKMKNWHGAIGTWLPEGWRPKQPVKETTPLPKDMICGECSFFDRCKKDFNISINSAACHFNICRFELSADAKRAREKAEEIIKEEL